MKFFLLSAATLVTGLVLLLTDLAQSQPDPNVTVRIVAQQLDDGRMEFALQQHNGESWGERILPPARFLPESPETALWYTSSAMDVGPPPTPLVAMLDTDQIELGEFTSGTFGERGAYQHIDGGEFGLQTIITAWAETDGGQHESHAQINFICNHDSGVLWINAFLGSYDPESAVWSSTRHLPTHLMSNASFGVVSQRNWNDYALPQIESAWTSDFLPDGRLYAANVPEHAQSLFMIQAKHHRWLSMRFNITRFSTGLVAVSFDLRGGFETPAQSLFEDCLSSR